MNKLLTTALVAAAAVSSAATASYNASATTNNSWADINLQKFNTALGTLNSVTITLNYANLGGSFTTSTAGTVTVEDAAGSVYVKQSSANNVGFTQKTALLFDVTGSVTPVLPDAISAGSQTYAIATTTALGLYTLNVDAQYFSVFESLGGSGFVVFQTRNSPSISVTGSTYTMDSSLFTVTTDMTVTYNYTAAPVPEASTYGIALGGLALAGAIVRRRRSK